MPWYITEVGQCLGGAGCADPTDLTGQSAAVTQYLNDIITKYTWVKFLAWYEIRDDSTGNWGLLNTDNSPRPSYTALGRAWALHVSMISG